MISNKWKEIEKKKLFKRKKKGQKAGKNLDSKKQQTSLKSLFYDDNSFQREFRK